MPLSPETIALAQQAELLDRLATLPMFAADDPGQWRTIGSKEGGDGKKHGGTPVKIGKGGDITAGPKGLTGHKPDAIPKRAKPDKTTGINPASVPNPKTDTEDNPVGDGETPAEKHGIRVPDTLDEAKKLAEFIRRDAIDEYGDDLKNMCVDVARNIYTAFKPYSGIFSGDIAGNFEEGGHHVVASVNGFLIDVTADQFGKPKVIVTPEDSRDGTEHGSFRRKLGMEKNFDDNNPRWGDVVAERWSHSNPPSAIKTKGVKEKRGEPLESADVESSGKRTGLPQTDKPSNPKTSALQNQHGQVKSEREALQAKRDEMKAGNAAMAGKLKSTQDANAVHSDKVADLKKKIGEADATTKKAEGEIRRNLGMGKGDKINMPDADQPKIPAGRKAVLDAAAKTLRGQTPGAEPVHEEHAQRQVDQFKKDAPAMGMDAEKAMAEMGGTEAKPIPVPAALSPHDVHGKLAAYMGGGTADAKSADQAMNSLWPPKVLQKALGTDEAGVQALKDSGVLSDGGNGMLRLNATPPQSTEANPSAPADPQSPAQATPSPTGESGEKTPQQQDTAQSVKKSDDVFADTPAGRRARHAKELQDLQAKHDAEWGETENAIRDTSSSP